MTVKNLSKSQQDTLRWFEPDEREKKARKWKVVWYLGAGFVFIAGVFFKLVYPYFPLLVVLQVTLILCLVIGTIHWMDQRRYERERMAGWVADYEARNKEKNSDDHAGGA